MGNTRTSYLIVGAGKMGEAIVAGWLSRGACADDVLAPEEIVCVNPGEARRQHMEQTYGVATVADVTEASSADVIVLAVKPQVMSSVLQPLNARDGFGGPAGPLYISIAAGISTSTIESQLPAGTRVVRVMPNTPLLVGAGASAVCRGAAATDDDLAFVLDKFAQLGQAHVVDERDMDAVCAVSGSGPAYVCALIEEMRDAAARNGLDAHLAEQLALQTVYGTAKQLLETGQTPQDAREAVCSPGGTTLAALDAMADAGFGPAIGAGVDAAVKRSKELGACS